MVYRSCMIVERIAFSATVGIPELDRAVAAAGRQSLAVGREGHARYGVRVSSQECFLFPGNDLPEPGGRIAAAGCQRVPVGREGQAGHYLGVSP